MARSGLAGRGVPPGGQPVAHRYAVDLVAWLELGLGLGEDPNPDQYRHAVDLVACIGLGLGLGIG